jgi:hypothetical protein
MPEDKSKIEKMVDIDTTGPGADIEIEDKQTELESKNENTKEDNKSDNTTEKSDDPVAVQTSEPKKEQEVKSEDNTQKKELDDYSEGVQKRIAKLTKKMREAERQREAAIDYARKVQVERDSLNGRLNKLDTGYVSEMENRIKSSIEAAVVKMTRARETGDLKAEILAQSEIAKLGYEEAKLNDLKEKQAQQVELNKERNQQPYVQPQYVPQEQPVVAPDAKAQTWADRNDWFGKDEPMTFTAFSLHKKLVDEEGYDPLSDEYYAEIDRRIRLEFPHKFGNTNTQSTEVRPTQTVASATRNSSSKTSRKTVRLTPSQVAIAKKLGVPLEEYAKQLTLTKEV